MIAYLRGSLHDIQPNHIVLDVNGVGYLVHVPKSLSESLSQASHPPGEDHALHIATIVREDAITLYGFEDTLQREAFELLRQVKGVGPRVALAILGTLGLSEATAAITQDRPAQLVRAPGVGKRLASRLCLELKDKMPAHFQVAATPAAASGHQPRFVAPQDPLPLALAQLGYRKSEIDVALSDPDVPTLDAAPIEQRLSAALRVFQRQ